MTLFIQLKNGVPSGYPIEETNFRQLFPQTSFPAFFTADMVEPLGYGIYDFSNRPETGRYEKAVEVTPVRNDAGIWKQTWSVRSMTAEEKADADKIKSDEIRAERNYRLLMSDYTQLPDVPVDHAAWAVYRADLRNVSAQAGFPWEVTWPTPPGAV